MKFAKKVFGESNKDIWNDVENYVTALEAKRVEAVPTDGRSICEMAKCPHWNNGECMVLSCGVSYVYDYLLTGSMIREAK